MAVTRAESRASMWAAAIAFLLVAQQVAGKSVRDALFLSSYGPSLLPQAIAVTVFVSLASILVSSRLAVWVGPKRFLLGAIALATVLFVIAAGQAGGAPGHAGWLLYGLIAVFGSIISGFWSIVSELFNPASGRRLIGRISTGATIGGLAGAGLAKGAADFLGTEACLWALGALGTLTCLLTFRLPTTDGKGRKAPSAPQRHSTSTRYLTGIALMLFATAFASALADYVFKAEVSAEYTNQDELLGFFATFYAVVSLLTVLVQTVLSGPLLERFGLGIATATLPTSVFATSAASLVGGHWLLFAAIRGADSIASNSLFRSGYELLYTPVSRELKRRYKPIIDVGAIRTGDLTAAVLLFLLGGTVASAPLIVVCAAVSLVALLLLRAVHRGYVRTLTQQLQSGTVDLAVRNVADMTTLRTLSEVTSTLDRESLLRGIRDFQAQQRESPPPPSATLSSEALANYGQLDSDDVAQAAELLDDAVLGALAERAVRHHLRRDRRMLLERLFDPAFVARAGAALSRLIASDMNLWSERVLLSGLAHPEPQVRNVCADTLARNPLRNHPPASRGAMLRYVAEELARVSREKGDPRAALQRVFRVLAVTHDPKQIESAARGFFSDQRRLQGSALELVSTAVSPEIAQQLDSCGERLVR